LPLDHKLLDDEATVGQPVVRIFANDKIWRISYSARFSGLAMAIEQTQKRLPTPTTIEQMHRVY
jgi:hypothetical protein